MDIDEIKNGLRGVALAEPPLGFDPDDIATRAATSMRNRRAVIGTGLVVAFLAAAAVGIAGDRGQARDTAPADRSMAELMAHNEQHLREVLPGLLPNAADVSVGPFAQPYIGTSPGPSDKKRLDSATSEVTFRDDAGPAYFNLSIIGPDAADGYVPLEDACPQDRLGSRGCRRLPQPDGSTVVVSWSASDPNQPRDVAVDATHYRTDGSRVSTWNFNVIGAALAEKYGQRNPDGTLQVWRSRAPLTEEQVIRLVIDPEFSAR